MLILRLDSSRNILSIENGIHTIKGITNITKIKFSLIILITEFKVKIIILRFINKIKYIPARTSTFSFPNKGISKYSLNMNK